jgi:hypothetical protein
MSYPKHHKLVDSLHQRTKDNWLSWQITPDEMTFQVSFPAGSIQISKIGRGTGHEYYEIMKITLFNDKAEEVDQILSNSVDEDGYYYSNLMVEIYEMARRQATGAEKTLDDLIEELRNTMPF